MTGSTAKKMIDEKDQQITMEDMLGQRKLTTGEIQKHFNCFGLEPAFAEHTRMGALSGGQKVKVVLGAGLWNLPHLVILDEPTNFLDRDSLGALAMAIKEFKGGIFMSITLKQARIIAEASIAKGRELDLKPLSVVILDPRTSLVACNSEEGVSQMRWRIAQGKANAAIQLGMGTRALMVRAEQQA